jgi:hypothetical protein
MPRFVILEHDHPYLHWDVMLESGTVLRTWRLAAPPSRQGAIAATAVLDHRLLYLDYEGPISGDRGQVVRWDHGTFSGEVKDAKLVAVHLAGERIRGVLRLQHAEGDSWNGAFQADSP